ncbi:MAG: hypothetical protein AAFP69_20775, partial [Planctomycetota bacterium]
MHLPSVSTQHRIDEWSWYRVGRISPLVLLCLTLCSLAIGCSQEDLEDLKKKTADLAGDAGTVLKDAADDAVGAGQDMAMAAKEMVDQDGQAEFTLDGKSYTTNAAMLHLMKFSDGRHGRLMIVSHPPMQSPDSFPAFVVQCDVTPDTQMVDMLKGQSLDADGNANNSASSDCQPITIVRIPALVKCISPLSPPSTAS